MQEIRGESSSREVGTVGDSQVLRIVKSRFSPDSEEVSMKLGEVTNQVVDIEWNKMGFINYKVEGKQAQVYGLGIYSYKISS